MPLAVRKVVSPKRATKMQLSSLLFKKALFLLNIGIQESPNMNKEFQISFMTAEDIAVFTYKSI